MCCQTPDAYLVSSRQVANGGNNADTAPKTCIFTDNEAYPWDFWKSSDVCIFLRSYPSYWEVYCQQALSVELAYCSVCERSPFPPIFGRQCDKLTTPQNENSSPNGELPATSGNFLINNIGRSTGLEPNHRFQSFSTGIERGICVMPCPCVTLCLPMPLNLEVTASSWRFVQVL
jgi:hypothetical protein